jgi:hypothetical protein
VILRRVPARPHNTQQTRIKATYVQVLTFYQQFLSLDLKESHSTTITIISIIRVLPIVLISTISIINFPTNCALHLNPLRLRFRGRNRKATQKDIISLPKQVQDKPPLVKNLLISSKLSTIRASKKKIMSDPKTSNIVYGSDDELFGCIERSHESTGKSFGRFLDAGTGTHSLRWMASLIGDNRKSLDLSIDDYTAITADEGMKRNVLKEATSLGIEDTGRIIIGNWQAEGAEEDELCHGETFDTILADYLVGAMDGFSPYYQDLIFPRLCKHLKPGGRLYVVGLNPIPHKTSGDANIFCEVTRLRDACILLAGHRCYREYPVEWIERHLEKAGLKVISSSNYPIMYTHAAIVRQLNVARSKLPLFPSEALAKEMGEAIDALEEESKLATDRSPNGRLRIGFDYVVSAEMPNDLNIST